MNAESPIPINELTIAYVENNLRRLDDVLDDEIATWQQILEASDTSADLVNSEIRRLEDLRVSVGDIITVHRITEPIDLTFVLRAAEYLDAAEAYAEQFGGEVDPEYERNNVLEIVARLTERNSAEIAA